MDPLLLVAPKILFVNFCVGMPCHNGTPLSLPFVQPKTCLRSGSEIYNLGLPVTKLHLSGCWFFPTATSTNFNSAFSLITASSLLPFCSCKCISSNKSHVIPLRSSRHLQR